MVTAAVSEDMLVSLGKKCNINLKKINTTVKQSLENWCRGVRVEGGPECLLVHERTIYKM